ncbi:MAG: pyrimidine 5'-nucleotidase [Hyphomicrobiales bacterium]|nr:pyrimidine 5'-nucleotidase [Hyphomicrobiales bacterium]
MERFARTDCWIFDLDNTLYPAECNLFLQVDQRMGEFIASYLDVPFIEARRLQKDYYRKFGTTLSGLMQCHGLDPEKFLDYVHDIDVSMLPDGSVLGAALDRLPGRRYIFTNGSRGHAENVAGALGILDRFDDVFDIGAAGYVPKPDRDAYRRFLDAHGVKAESAAMFEDMPQNLAMPHAFGMVTVLVKARNFDHPAQRGMDDWEAPPDHVHHITEDLTGFLSDVTEIHWPEDAEPAD